MNDHKVVGRNDPSGGITAKPRLIQTTDSEVHSLARRSPRQRTQPMEGVTRQPQTAASNTSSR